MSNSNKENSSSDKRINDILLGPLERPALDFFCRRMPKWVNPDHLTVFGVLAGFLVGVSYALTSFSPNYLWLASFGLVLHWFGDSLDGNLARYRKIERPKYGYFVDHIADAYITTVVCIGIGLSPYVDLMYALFCLIAYLLMSVLTYVTTNVTGVFKISYGKFGPTEIRLVIILANVYFYFGPNPLLNMPGFQMTFYNFMAVVVALLIGLYFIFFSLKQIRDLYRKEPLKNTETN